MPPELLKQVGIALCNAIKGIFHIEPRHPAGRPGNPVMTLEHWGQADSWAAVRLYNPRGYNAMNPWMPILQPESQAGETVMDSLVGQRHRIVLQAPLNLFTPVVLFIKRLPPLTGFVARRGQQEVDSSHRFV